MRPVSPAIKASTWPKGTSSPQSGGPPSNRPQQDFSQPAGSRAGVGTATVGGAGQWPGAVSASSFIAMFPRDSAGDQTKRGQSPRASALAVLNTLMSCRSLPSARIFPDQPSGLQLQKQKSQRPQTIVSND